jgi:hypothetical protein
LIRWMAANRRLGSSLAALTVALAAGPARAQGTNTALAEALFREGKRLMGAGNYAEACPKIAESQRLDPGAGTLLNLAACHEAEGKIATAWAEYGEAASLARRDGRADREQFASAHALALEPKLPRLALEISAEAAALTSLEIRIDDVIVGRVAWSVPGPIDPGAHVITASAAGKKPFRSEVQVPATPDVLKVAVAGLEDAPVAAAAPAAGPAASTAPGADRAPASSGNGRTVGIAVGAAGLVAIGVGSYFGLQAFSKWHERNDHCPQGACDATAVEASDAAHTDARVADIAVGLGIVGVGVGTYLFLTAPSAANKPAAASGWVGVGAVSRGAPGVTAGGVW